jgi:hypothetical protein
MLCGQPNPNHGHGCVADEHFIASLLATYAQDESRDNVGFLTHTNWLDSSGWHPLTYYPGDVMAHVYAMRSLGPNSRYVAKSQMLVCEEGAS